MPKQLKKIEDFSGGTNGYSDPQNIQDNELAQCSGFKSERGEIVVLGDMKGAYTLGGSDTAAGENISIESGYGLFTFSHDYDKDGNLVSTNYYVIQNANSFNIYDDTANAWIDNSINLGTSLSDNPMASFKPCFLFVDGALRISPGNFDKVNSGSSLNSHPLISTTNNQIDQVVATSTADTLIGDLAVIDGIEVIVSVVFTTSGPTEYKINFWRNLTGSFPGISGASSAIYLMPDTRWHGIVNRRNFQSITTIGTFTEWYTTFMHPRSPPIRGMVHTPDDFVLSFRVAGLYSSADVSLLGEGPIIHVGYKDYHADPEGIWDSTYSYFITALYDDVKQESQPTLIAADLATDPGYRVLFWVGIEYASAATTTYSINKRVTGARLYYQDTDSDDNNLYQLLEIDFVKGCKKITDDKFSPWVRWGASYGGSASDYAVACPTDNAAANANRNITNAFSFVIPPNIISYAINTGYEADVNTHARFKTAVIANRRLYAGNVYQDGKAHGDRMLKSPVNKFDLLPSTNQIDVTVGDGDEIVKLETFADRILQFKKRTLYLINVGGEYEFLESEHTNMGVENPSQVCKTEYGIAWVNKFGVYIYDGQKITELTKGKLKLVDTTAATSSQEHGRARALNVTESYIPLIGYHSLNKWLIIHPESTITDDYDTVAWIFDFKNGSWTWSQEFTTTNEYKTNIINTHNNELVLAAGTNSSNTPDFFKLQDGTNDPAANKLFLLTKDFTLDVPSVKKNIYSVYVTYSVAGDTNLEADLIYKDSTGETIVAMEEASGSTYYDDSVGFKSTSSEKITVELVPSSSIKSANSFQFKISNPDGVHDISDDFRLYSISFRYRTKGVH